MGFINSGQACVAGTRILVQNHRQDEILFRLKREIETFKVGAPRRSGRDDWSDGQSEAVRPRPVLYRIGTREGQPPDGRSPDGLADWTAADLRSRRFSSASINRCGSHARKYSVRFCRSSSTSTTTRPSSSKTAPGMDFRPIWHRRRTHAGACGSTGVRSRGRQPRAARAARSLRRVQAIGNRSQVRPVRPGSVPGTESRYHLVANRWDTSETGASRVPQSDEDLSDGFAALGTGALRPLHRGHMSARSAEHMRILLLFTSGQSVSATRPCRSAHPRPVFVAGRPAIAAAAYHRTGRRDAPAG